MTRRLALVAAVVAALVTVGTASAGGGGRLAFTSFRQTLP